MPKAKLSESFMVEAVAFKLYVRSCFISEGLVKAIGEEDMEKLRAAWRADTELRKRERKSALELMQDLEEQGVRIVITRSEKLRATVERLVTVPAHRAYELGDA